MGSPFVYVYSRAQAIEDGEQVRCPDKIRKEAGIKVPVFFTSSVWNNYIVPSKKLADEYGQSIDGRLWDVLSMWHYNVKRQQPEAAMTYQVVLTMPYASRISPPSSSKGEYPKGEGVKKGKGIDGAGECYQKTVTLYSVIGPTDFDAPEPAITIMLPGED